jgi:hypothetical protein
MSSISNKIINQNNQNNQNKQNKRARPDILESYETIINPEEKISSPYKKVYENKEEYLEKIDKIYNNLINNDTNTPKTNKEITDKIIKLEKLIKETKYKYNYEDVRKKLIKYEQSLLTGQLSHLRLYNEEYDFTERIPLRPQNYFNYFTEIKKIKKESFSNSFIFKGKFNNKLCYIKLFFFPNSNLEYEQKIYRYIKTRNIFIKPFYEKYFVKLFDVCKVLASDLKNFLTTENVKSTDDEMWYSDINFIKNICSKKYAYLIITEDIEGEIYDNFFVENYKNYKLIINTIFDLIYGIYLMNDKLKIMHNDNHFYNVFIKTNIEPYECFYYFNYKKYKKINNYKICFYDFDMSFLYNHENPYLNTHVLGIKQNKFSAKDIWTLLNCLYSLYKKCKSSYINNLIRLIINDSKQHYDLLQKIYLEAYQNTESKFWNAYCVDNEQNPCIIPDEKFLYPKEVLIRFVEQENIIKILNLQFVDNFYEKYIKYKIKYLKLKKF